MVSSSDLYVGARVQIDGEVISLPPNSGILVEVKAANGGIFVTSPANITRILPPVYEIGDIVKIFGWDLEGEVRGVDDDRLWLKVGGTRFDIAPSKVALIRKGAKHG